MKTIQIFYFDAGGGHRAAARALEVAIQKEQRPWKLELIQLQDLLLPADLIYRVTGVPAQDAYNWLLRHGFTRYMNILKKGLHLLLNFLRPTHIRMMRRFWGRSSPDLVVSVIPNLNATLYRALQSARPGVPYVTILTDFADFPPHFWIEEQDQYVICGTERAVDQAVAAGIAENRIFKVSGMILHPRFYEPPGADRDQDRAEIAPHLARGVPTGIVLFGGYGAPVMYDIAKQLDRVDAPVQMLFLCGHNEDLADRINRLPTRYAKQVVTFTDEVPRYMRLADFLIGKPGPGSISEALQMKLPVIVEQNSATMIQERYNTTWVQETGVGIVVKDFRRETAGAVQRMLGPAGREFAARAAAINNRAVFEIPAILEEILARGMN